MAAAVDEDDQRADVDRIEQHADHDGRALGLVRAEPGDQALLGDGFDEDRRQAEQDDLADVAGEEVPGVAQQLERVHRQAFTSCGRRSCAL
ncbi:hypothetical protein FQZ97_1074730 [compost metagenome]